MEADSTPFEEIALPTKVKVDEQQAVRVLRSYGLRGGKRLYEGYNKERKVVGRKEKEAQRGKHFYAGTSTQAAPAKTPFPESFRDRIVCGDSRTFLKKLPDHCVDLVFTSPPYNFGLDYNTGDDDQGWKTYFNELFVVLGEAVRVLCPGGRIVVNIQPLYSDFIPSHHVVSNFFMEQGLIWKGEVLWEKNNYNCKYSAWGSWKSPSNPYLKTTWEFLEVFCKGSLKKEGNKENADITADEFKKWTTCKWSIAPERKMKDYGHPAMFPEALAERVIKLFSFKGDVVLDPFNGVGTTTFVAKKFGRRFLGIDLDKTYCQTAEKRLGKLSSEQMELL